MSDYKLIYKVTKSIFDEWCEYDKTIAKTHLDNYGIIFLDKYDCPIDNTDYVEGLYLDFRDDFLS